jgi:hypothetical protein
MSWQGGLVEKQCPICGSLDTCFVSWNSTDAELDCRKCRRTVWKDHLNGDASTTEWLYLEDGSTLVSVKPNRGNEKVCLGLAGGGSLKSVLTSLGRVASHTIRKKGHLLLTQPVATSLDQRL